MTIGPPEFGGSGQGSDPHPGNAADTVSHQTENSFPLRLAQGRILPAPGRGGAGRFSGSLTRRRSHSTARRLSNAIGPRTDQIARHLFPKGRRRGGEYIVGDLDGNPGASLNIRLTGPKRGVWCDFATDERGGDLLDLWARVRGYSTLDAIHNAIARAAADAREAGEALTLDASNAAAEAALEELEPDAAQIRYALERAESIAAVLGRAVP